MYDKKLIAIFKKLLATPSYEPLKSNVPDLIADILSKHHISYEILTSNGIRNIVAKTNGAPKIILNGHWDTILPSYQTKKDKLKVLEKDGYIHGVGACDMKSGVAAMIGCFIECVKENIEGVVLCLVGDEEVGGFNGSGYLASQGIVAPYVILGEPSNFTISLGQKGIIEVKVRAYGKEAHGAYLHKGDNAILKMYHFVEEVLQKFPIPKDDVSLDEAFNMTTASVNQIIAGTYHNVVPASCVAKIDVRVSGKSSIEAVEKELLSLAKKIGVEVFLVRHGVGWEFDRHNRIFEISSKAVAKATKKSPHFIKNLGSTDGKYYLPYGSQVVSLGPGDSDLIHTINEKILPEDIIIAKNIYLEIVKNI